MHEINPYNISGAPEKHLELGLHLAAPLQYAKKPIDNRAGEREPRDLWNMSLPSFGAQSNYLHHGHVARARKRRSVFTAAQRLSHRISPDYPGEKSSVTFPQITHSWSESNLHSLPLPPRRDLTMTPTEEPLGERAKRALEKKKAWPLPRIHNSCSFGSPRRVPVQHFPRTYLLFIFLISAGASLRCRWWLLKTRKTAGEREKNNADRLNDWFCSRARHKRARVRTKTSNGEPSLMRDWVVGRSETSEGDRFAGLPSKLQRIIRKRELASALSCQTLDPGKFH